MAVVEQIQERADGRRRLRLSNPATLAPVGEIEVDTAIDVQAAIDRARKAQPGWAELSFEERGRFLERAVRMILAREDQLLDVIVSETGKPRVEALTTELLTACDALQFYAKRAKRILAPLGALAPATPEAGYALQKEVALRLGGLPPAGFKIGATTKQMQSILGLAGPAAGFVPKSGLRASPATARYADFVNPGLECEVGLRLARDIAPGPCTRGQAAEAVGEVFAAMEIVEKRYDDLAKLYGAAGFRVEKPGEAEDALRAALACGGPAIVDVMIDPDALYSFRRDSFQHRAAGTKGTT